MKKFTPLSAGLILFALLQFVALQNTFAQTKNSGVTIRVTVAGVSTDFGEFECGYGAADYGGSVTEDICAPIEWGRDIAGLDSLVCDSIPAGSLTGKIALLRRGGCPVAAAGAFTAKALNAEKAGALAVLIANHSATAGQTDCYTQFLYGNGAATTIPVFFLSRTAANFINNAINSGQPLEVCLMRPDVFMNEAFYPVQNVQTPITQIGTDTFGFSATLTNSRGLELTNVKVNAKVFTAAGAELFSTTLDIPSLSGEVSDSLFVLPERFAPELPIGNYRIVYTTESDSTNGSVFKDVRRSAFNVTQNLFSKDDNIVYGFRPGTLPANGWAAGNLYSMSTGAQDNYKVMTVEFAHASNAAERPINQIVSDIALFRVNDDVAADWNLFEGDDYQSPSFTWIGTGGYTAPSNATSYQVQQVTMLDLVSAEPGILLENGAVYVLSAFYPDSSRFAFHAFDPDVNVAGPSGISTVTYSTQWFLGGFEGNPSAVLRMYIDLVTTTDEKPLPDTYMNVFPNPVKDVLNLGLSLEKATDVTVTIAELSGRTIQIEDYYGLTNETVTYQLPQLASGVYLARIATKEGTLTKKFVVQK
ncbi:MAG: T9SS type A sorting domain-containing protein [Saprospiraceae bacterium]|nr:T9SS type A sorting domain-containing protein [Saprospiraceae bacterium]